MKKYFVFAAVAIAALASCSKVEPEVEAPEQEVNFMALSYAKATKATKVDFYANGHFGVYAYYTPGAWSSYYNTTNKTTYMENVDIYNQSDVWKAEAKYYWPRAGKLSFIGYYPYADKGVGKPSAITTGETPTVQFSSYVVAGTLDAQAALVSTNYDKNDLMVADFVKDQSSNEGTTNEPTLHTSTTGVAMLFHHLLAKVKFTAQIKDLSGNELQNSLPLTAVVNEIQLKSIANTGNYDGAAWGSQSGSVDSGKFVDVDQVSSGDDIPDTVLTTTPADQGSEYYVLPQALSSTTKLYVKYTVYSYDKTTNKIVEVPAAYEKTVELDDLTIASWDKNNIYTYNIIIDPFNDEIVFDPAVVDWDDYASTPDVE